MPGTPLETSITDLTQSIGLLLRRLRSETTTRQLTLTEAAVLSRPAKEGPATTADLARAECMKPQSTGTTIAALEEMGMVHRKPHATDGRQLDIELTTKGAAIRKSAKDSKRQWLTKTISQLEKHERESLFKASEIIRRLLAVKQLPVTQIDPDTTLIVIHLQNSLVSLPTVQPISDIVNDASALAATTQEIIASLNSRP